MPVLKNARQEAFAQGLAKGLTADQAYQDAGFKPNRHNAAALARKQHISTRVEELQGKAIKATELTAQKVLEGLLVEATRTGEGSSHGARVSAWGLIGKHFKMFTDKVEADINVNDGSDARSKLEHLLSRHIAGTGAGGDTGKPH